MGVGFLELAYMGEISIVFNLAYAELKSQRYFEKGKSTVQEIRSKTEFDQYIHVNNNEWYSRLKNIDSIDPAERSHAWRIKGESGIKTAILARFVYPFFSGQEDRHVAFWFSFITSFVLVVSTMFDHLHYVSESLWWGTFLVLFVSVCYPPIAIFLGRRVQARLEWVVNEIQQQFDESQKSNVRNLAKQGSESLLAKPN